MRNRELEKQEVIKKYREVGVISEVSRLCSVPASTVRRWVMTEQVKKADEDHHNVLRHRIKALEGMLMEAKSDRVDEAYVRSRILQLAEADLTPPPWLVKPKIKKGRPGVPSLLATDWHWGEVVEPSQINGVNEYNLAIAHRRARTLIEKTIMLLSHYTVNPEYPGIVFNLGGDMVSGDIHEELSQTNEAPIMPVVIDLVGVLIWCVKALRDKFGKVFVPCVPGNHARNTKKMRAKDAHHTSFDWLIYAILERHFADDPNVKIAVASSPDLLYSVLGYRYLLTHGDQFRGGDGMIGALGPIIRGDHKKRSRNGAIDMDYDTMLMGHWHQYMPLDRIVVNGSLVGYNEYANRENFGFELPRQALWITHPELGMINRNPVYVDPPRAKHAAQSDSWVSWHGEGAKNFAKRHNH